MQSLIRKLIGGAALLGLLAGPALAAGFFTNGVPPAGGSQYPSTIPLTGNETIPADTNLTQGLNPASEAVSTTQLLGYVSGRPSLGNALVGGDATTNLWQRGTTGASETTTFAYGGPDRWAYWSGTSTAVTVSRDSTAADLPTGYQYAFKMARTSGQTGVVQVCMAQEVESVNSYQFAGQTAELDFHAATGANFSAASPGFNMTAYIVSGTGADEGMQKLAFGLNGGGGGSTGWTGQTNATAAVISLGGVSTAGRYATIGTVPVGATEVGVALCWTPTGTAGTNDYIAFSGIQLVRNPANASLVSSTVGYSSATNQLAAFERRPQGIETSLQYRYFQALTEPAASISVAPSGQGASTTTCVLSIPLSGTMRAAPTFAAAGTALTTTTWTVTHVVTNTALATPFLAATTGGSTTSELNLTATVASGLTAGQTCTLTGAAGGSILQASAEL